MTTVRVKENEPFEVAMRRFKRSVEKTGLLTELRAREFYEKPTAERKRKGETALADPVNALYVNSTVEHLRELANKLAEQGLIELDGDSAHATEALAKHADSFQADMKSQLEALQKKHAFERG